MEYVFIDLKQFIAIVVPLVIGCLCFVCFVFYAARYSAIPSVHIFSTVCDHLNNLLDSLVYSGFIYNVVSGVVSS